MGESSTLSLKLSGTGNAQMLSEPILPELPQFKVYDDKPSGSLDRSGERLSGSKTYRKALVPLQPGQLSIPGLQLVYFDPVGERYRSQRTADIAVDVRPADGREELMLTEGPTAASGKVAVQILADDVLPIHVELDAVRDRGLGGLTSVLLSVAALFPPLLYVAFVAGMRRRRLLASDGRLRKRHRALRRALSELEAVSEDSECKYDPAALARRCSRCLREYIGDMLGAEGSALTLVEVDELLERAGASESTVRRVHDLLERFEAAQFSASGAPSALGHDRDKTARGLTNVIRDLDQELRGLSK